MSRLVSTTSYPTEDKEGSYSLNPPNYSLERSKRQTAHRMRLEESCLPVMVVVCWLYIKLYLVESGILHACQKNICSVFQPVCSVFSFFLAVLFVFYLYLCCFIAHLLPGWWTTTSVLPALGLLRTVGSSSLQRMRRMCASSTTVSLPQKADILLRLALNVSHLSRLICWPSTWSTVRSFLHSPCTTELRWAIWMECCM